MTALSCFVPVSQHRAAEQLAHTNSNACFINRHVLHRRPCYREGFVAAAGSVATVRYHQGPDELARAGTALDSEGTTAEARYHLAAQKMQDDIGHRRVPKTGGTARISRIIDSMYYWSAGDIGTSRKTTPRTCSGRWYLHSCSGWSSSSDFDFRAKSWQWLTERLTALAVVPVHRS